jgi:hypothetical protein
MGKVKVFDATGDEKVVHFAATPHSRAYEHPKRNGKFVIGCSCGERFSGSSYHIAENRHKAHVEVVVPHG